MPPKKRPRMLLPLRLDGEAGGPSASPPRGDCAPRPSGGRCAAPGSPAARSAMADRERLGVLLCT